MEVPSVRFGESLPDRPGPDAESDGSRQPPPRKTRDHDRVRISREARALHGQKTVTEKVLDRMGPLLAGSKNRLAATPEARAPHRRLPFGAAYASGEARERLSPTRTASIILDRIRGPILSAFRSGRSSTAPGDLERFRRQILRGFEEGLGEARETLTLISALDTELDDAIERTAELVREGVAELFAGEVPGEARD